MCHKIAINNIEIENVGQFKEVFGEYPKLVTVRQSGIKDDDCFCDYIFDDIFQKRNIEIDEAKSHSLLTTVKNFDTSGLIEAVECRICKNVIAMRRVADSDESWIKTLRETVAENKNYDLTVFRNNPPRKLNGCTCKKE